jgi:hypothetical protein
MFPLGSIVATPNALHTLAAHGRTPAEFLARHARGDWGDIGPEDARENALSLARGFRLFSSYAYDVAQPEVRVWIITEADRSSTCVLLPEDY